MEDGDDWDCIYYCFDIFMFFFCFLFLRGIIFWIFLIFRVGFGFGILIGDIVFIFLWGWFSCELFVMNCFLNCVFKIFFLWGSNVVWVERCCCCWWDFMDELDDEEECKGF